MKGDGFGVPRRRRDGTAHSYAAIDLGTNNCRMLVARPTRSRFRVIDAFSRIVRLGEGLHASGVLSAPAMERTIAALDVCAGKMRRWRVARARSVATEACRRAANHGTFLARVAAATGITLEIISDQEEARLTVEGCLPLLDADARLALVFDIGGGSTELIWLRKDGGAAPDIVAWTSLPLGVVTLAEEYGGDRIPRAVYRAMVERVRGVLAPFAEETGIDREVAAGGVDMLGASGTMTTIAGVFLNLPRYDRTKVDGLRLGYADVEAVSARLLALDRAGRAAIPTIGPDRADLVVAGCAVLEAIHGACPVGRLRVADRGVREGMLLGMMQADRRAASGSAGWPAPESALGAARSAG